ncbi:aldehyde dehydrogenase [Leisingera aquaemixtae]|uniref:aldehyde dehydrogenase n=1 Tax=Leisingera aquaemixtae TaxID=1396826 RepID=UPI001C94DDB5|nr:aldehyde dehydrogenase [Leisingera aquaemixtae]MBY6069417.1 aldehyde dehydrogenase [Leisingera aquaemixtae]
MPGHPASGKGSRQALLRLAAACAALCSAISQAHAQASEDSEFGQLVAAEGAEETYYVCTACHSEMIVAQQGKTREGWSGLLDWMTEEQGMPELDPDERRIILDYLSAHYNTDRPNFPLR